MNSQILDTTILVKVFEAYDENELKQWGLHGFTTRAVEVSSLKRVFWMIKEYTKKENYQKFYFLSPQKEPAAFLTSNISIRPHDTLKIKYIITAFYERGPGSVIIRTPNGKLLSVNIYATCS